MDFHRVKMYKDKEVNKNVKNISLSMCDVRVFLTFTFVVKILQVTRGCWWRWFTLDVPPSSLNLVLLWQLFCLFCSSIVINTVIVTAGTFEPLWKQEIWRLKIWFNPQFLSKSLSQVRVITVSHSFPVVDWFCLFIYLWIMTFPLEDCSEFGNFVITLIFSELQLLITPLVSLSFSYISNIRYLLYMYKRYIVFDNKY
jgi:hypothetical protein